MTDQEILTDALIMPFDSLVHLREQHEQLLAAFEDSAHACDEKSTAEIQLFLQRVIKTGSHIYSVTNRALAQNIVDFWNGYLLRHDLVLAWEGRPRLLPASDSELPSEKEVACPYVGLDPFNRSNREIFFGRQDLTAGLLNDISEGNHIILSGPSGCGKSSLLQAGLPFDLEQKSFQIIGCFE